jgi:hypothetical protein
LESSNGIIATNAKGGSFNFFFFAAALSVGWSTNATLVEGKRIMEQMMTGVRMRKEAKERKKEKRERCAQAQTEGEGDRARTYVRAS